MLEDMLMTKEFSNAVTFKAAQVPLSTDVS